MGFSIPGALIGFVLVYLYDRAPESMQAAVGWMVAAVIVFGLALVLSLGFAYALLSFVR